MYGLEADEQRLRGAMLLASDRYTQQFAPFVKGKLARFAYVRPRVEDMLDDVAGEIGVDAEALRERYIAHIIESYTGTDPYPGVVKADLADDGIIDGAGVEDLLKGIEKQNLGEFSKKSCFRCEREFATKEATAVCHECTVELAKQSADWDQTPNEAPYADGLEDEWSDDAQEVHCPLCSGPGVSLGSLGRMQHYRCRNCGADFAVSVESKDQDDYNPETETVFEAKSADYDDQSGVGTGADQVAEPEIVQQTDSMPFYCDICKSFQGTRDEVLAHVNNDHADAVQRMQAEQGGTPASTEPFSNAYASEKKADVPRTVDDQAVVEPLPTNAADEFDSYVQDLAEQAAARRFSMPDDALIHSLSSQLGQDEQQIRDNLQVVAIFGNYVGVNGQIGGEPNAPEGYEEVSVNQNSQGNAHEALVPTDLVVSNVADKLNMEHELAYQEIRDRYGADLPTQYHASVTGEQHIYLPTDLAGNQDAQQPDPSVGPTPAQQPLPQQTPAF